MRAFAQQPSRPQKAAGISRAPPAIRPVPPTRHRGAIGNPSLHRSAGRRCIQAKLTISQHGDPAEQEADQIAGRVMSEPAPESVQTPCPACSSGGSTCPNCAAEKKIQPKALPGGTPTTSAPPVVHEVLSSPGQPLGMRERAFMEARFGQDFSGVRVHTGAKAAESTAAVHARAYTVGNNIIFGRNESASDLPVLAHELTHVIQQGGGASPALQRFPRPGGGGGGGGAGPLAGPAGDCGLCYGEEPGSIGPREAGSAAHRVIQNIMFANVGGIEVEYPWGNGRIDLALVREAEERIEIGEIKPANEAGIDDGFDQIEGRLRSLPALEEYEDYTVAPLRYPVMQPIRFETGAPVCLEQPGYCYSQSMSVAGPVGGLYLYFCEPTYAELLAGGCKCKCEDLEKDKKPKDKDPKDKGPDPDDLLPEPLNELGKDLLRWLGEAELLDIGLALGRVMLAYVATPLAALAAVVIGIAYFWDEIKSIAGAIAGVAEAVWDKILALRAWVLGALQKIRDKLYELGADVAKAISFVAGKIASFVRGLLDGVAYVAGRVWAGAKWLGRNIASGARAFWDWLWGDVEAEAPNIEFPVTEEIPQHCATVSQDDTIIKLDADVLFDTDKWEIRKEPEAQLPLEAAAKKIAPLLQKDDWVKFEGYTDNRGSFGHNQTLSEQRAEAVRSWFVAHGVVPMSRTRIEGFGKKMAKANDEEGRRNERRVDIWLPGHGTTRQVCWYQ